MRRLRAGAWLRLCTIFAAILPLGASSGGLASINPEDLKQWLTYIASDELQGRDTYSAGLGLASGYIQERLAAWDVRPAGDRGGYLQTVRVVGVKATSRSSMIVKVGNETRTFKDGEGVRFPRNAGVKRTFTLDRVEFAGYGLDVPASNHMDYRGKSVRGAAVVWLGASGPRGLDANYRRLLTGRNRYAIDQLQAAASIGAEMPRFGAGGGGASQASAGSRGGTAPDFTTAQRLDQPIPPGLSAGDAFFTFLFSRAKVRYENLKRLAEARDAL